MKNISILIFFILIMFASKVQAASWYFFEPGVGYYQGHYQTDKFTGLGFDFKLGLNWKNMFIGADVGYASALNSSGSQGDVGMNNTGLVLGWNLSGFRFWYTFVTGSTLSWKSGASEIESVGAGEKLGIGGKISGSTYLNLEINFLKYSEQSTDGAKADVDLFMDLAMVSFSWVY